MYATMPCFCQRLVTESTQASYYNARKFVSFINVVSEDFVDMRDCVGRIVMFPGVEMSDIDRSINNHLLEAIFGHAVEQRGKVVSSVLYVSFAPWNRLGKMSFHSFITKTTCVHFRMGKDAVYASRGGV